MTLAVEQEPASLRRLNDQLFRQKQIIDQLTSKLDIVQEIILIKDWATATELLTTLQAVLDLP